MDASPLGQLRELVAHAWFTIGYPPARSLVLVEVNGGGEAGVVARIDQPAALPPRPGQRGSSHDAPAPAAHRRAAAAMIASAAQRGGVRAAVLLVVQDPAGVERPAFGRAEAALVRAVRQALRVAGVRVAGVALVGSGWVRSLDCTDPRCCPPGGAPLGDLAGTRTAAGMVLRGKVLAADEAGLVADVEPVPWPGAVLLAEPPAAAAPLGLARWRALLQARLAAPRPGREPLPAEVAWLVAGLRDLRLRDAVLVSVLPAPKGAAFTRRPQDPAADLAAGRGESMPDITALTGSRPDAEVFEAARALLAQVARGAPPGSRAEALAVLGWMAWWQGSGARGRLLVGLALADDPAHRLAAIVDQLLAHAVPPSWVLPLRPQITAGRPGTR
jgi:Domain of unknown function (DUF4192)